MREGSIRHSTANVEHLPCFEIYNFGPAVLEFKKKKKV